MSALSIVVPSYNHAPFVERTLRSIFAQTRPPENLIVIDDGSEDESVRVVERVLKDCPFACELISRPNRGLSATLNQGLALSTGDLFGYIGSDDVWLPQFISEQMDLLERRPSAVLAFCHAYLIDENDRIIDSTANWTDFADGDMLPHLLGGKIFASAGVIYRRDKVEKYGWNEGSILEDYELYLRLSAEGEFARNPKILCGWRQHSTNVSRDFPLMMREWIAAQDRVADILPFSRNDLDTMQERLRFDSVASFVRSGRKREAMDLFIENLGGARGPRHIAVNLLRLSIPRRLFAANLMRKRNAAIAKYGSIDQFSI
ncbi:MAG: glycosyltransferase [Pyrinomonadaceae bacterium]